MHVVADRNAPTLTLIPGRIVLTFPTHSTDATVVDDCWDPRADWALLFRLSNEVIGNNDPEYRRPGESPGKTSRRGPSASTRTRISSGRGFSRERTRA